MSAPSEVLLTLARTTITLPQQSIFQSLYDTVKQAGDGIASTFFANKTTPFLPNTVDHTKDRDDFAQAYLSWELSFHTEHGFDGIIDGNKAFTFWQGWLNGKGTSVGRDMFFQYMRDKHNWGKVVENKTAILNDAAERMTTEEFVVTQILRLISGGNYTSIQMLLLFLVQLDGENGTVFESVKDAILTYAPSNLRKQELTNWNLDFFQGFVSGKLWLGASQHGLDDATVAAKVNASSSHTTNDAPDAAAAFGEIVSVYTTTTAYGQAVASWIFAGDAGAYATGKKPDNVHDKHHVGSPLAGCFGQGTLVVVGDCKGEFCMKPIETLAENDIVISANGSPSIRSEETVVTPVSQDGIMLFSFNDDEPFFSASHLFWTVDSGWKCIHPQLAMQESDLTSVKKLEVGDVVLRMSTCNTSDEGLYQQVEINRINTKFVSESTRLWGVHLREGSRSYHANGYLVAMNYPELTHVKLAKSIRSNLSFQERNIFCKKVGDFRPTLAKVVGSDTLRAIEDEVTNKKRVKKVELSREGHRRYDLLHQHENIVLSPTLAPGSLNALKEVEDYELPTLTLVGNGRVLVDGFVPRVFEIKYDVVTWTRLVGSEQDGLIEAGHVRIQGHGRLGFGSISIARKHSVSSGVKSFHVNLIQGQNMFHDRNGRFSVRLDHSLDKDGRPATLHPVILSRKGRTIGSGTCYPVAKNDSRLRISLKFHGAGWGSQYGEAIAELSPDHATMVGHISKHDVSKRGFVGDKEFLELHVDGAGQTQSRGQAPIIIEELASIGRRRFSISLKSPTGAEGPVSLDIVSGRIFVNGEPVHDPQYKDSILSWKRILSSGSVETGTFEIRSPFLYGTGFATQTTTPVLGKDAMDVIEGPPTEFTGAATIRQYLTIEKQLWRYSVELGYTEEGKIISALVDNESNSETKAATVKTITVAGQELQYTIDIDPLAGALLNIRYVYAKMAMDPFGMSSNGQIYDLDTSKPDRRGKAHDMHGSVSKPASIASAPTVLLMQKRSPTCPVKKYAARSHAVTSPQLDERTVPATEFLTTSSPLNIQTLLHMTPPDPSAVNRRAQTKIISFAQYAMTDDQRKLIGVDKPDTDDEEKGFVNQSDITSFLRDHYAKAYIAQGLRSLKQFDGAWTNSEDVDVTLNFFWSGHVKGTLGSFKEYTLIQDFAGRKAFEELAGDDLAPFLTSSSPQTWAKNLYDQLLNDQPTFNMVVDQYLAGDRTQLNKYSMILYSLDPNEEYSTKLWKAVVWGSFAQKVLQVSADDQEVLNQFIPKAFHDLILKILLDDNKLLKDLKSEAADALNELEIDQNQSAQHLADALNTSMVSYSEALLSAFRRLPQGTFGTRMAEAVSTISAKYPKLSAFSTFASSVMGLVAFGFSIYQTYESVLNWSKLTIEQKVQVVTNILSGAGEGALSMLITVKAISKLVKTLRNEPTDIEAAIDANGDVTFSMEAGDAAVGLGDSADEVAVSINEALVDVDSPGIIRAATEISSISAVEGEAVIISRFATAFNITSKLATALNAIALAAATVSIGFQVKGDFDGNASLALKLIDIADLVVTGVATAIAFGALVLGEAIPVIGIVLIILGAVLMIVSTIIRKHQPRPKTEQEKWIDSRGNAFINSIPKPTAAFAINQFDLKPTPKIVSGDTKIAFFNNLVDSVLEPQDIGNKGTFVAGSGTRLNVWRSVEKTIEFDFSASFPKGMKSNMYVITTEPLVELQGIGAMVWTTKWENVSEKLSSAVKMDGFFFYRVELVSKNGTWNLLLTANTPFEMNAAVQSIDVQTKPLKLKTA